MKAGTIRAVIDCAFPLEQILAAHRRMELRHKAGVVVVTMPAADRAAT